jgi:hypothetical protein
MSCLASTSRSRLPSSQRLLCPQGWTGTFGSTQRRRFRIGRCPKSARATGAACRSTATATTCSATDTNTRAASSLTAAPITSTSPAGRSAPPRRATEQSHAGRLQVAGGIQKREPRGRRPVQRRDSIQCPRRHAHERGVDHHERATTAFCLTGRKVGSLSTEEKLAASRWRR